MNPAGPNAFSTQVTYLLTSTTDGTNRVLTFGKDANFAHAVQITEGSTPGGALVGVYSVGTGDPQLTGADPSTFVEADSVPQKVVTIALRQWSDAGFTATPLS